MSWWRRKKEDREASDPPSVFDSVLSEFSEATDEESLSSALKHFNAVAENSGASHEDVQAGLLTAYALAVDTVVRDDAISDAEASVLSSIFEDIIPSPEKLPFLLDKLNKVRIALINQYGPTPVDSDLMGLDESETVFFDEPAVKLERRRTFAGRSQGVSFRIAPGVRFHTSWLTGGARVDDQWTPVDTGTLSATSKRILFRGDLNTTEIPLRKIVGMDVLNDGIQIHRSDRVNVLMWQCDSAPVLGAIINRLSTV